MRQTIALLFCFALASCARQSKPDLLLVTVDTLRADRLGSYGHAAARTSFFDQLAREGVRYERCMTPIPVTLPAHVSMLTGLLPGEHGVRNNLTYRLGTEVESAPEQLQRAGYNTGAFVSAFPLSSLFGIDRGFTHFDDTLQAMTSVLSFPERSAPRTVEAALKWLKEQPADQPVFLWVHFFEPHAPYEPPAPLDSQVPDAYDGEIAAVDAATRVLLAGVNELRGTAPITILTADHGEGLGEHGEDTHSFFLYESTLHVPLILHAPGRLEAAVVAEPVTLCDVAPTLMRFAGLPSIGSSGIPLESPHMPQRVLYAETLYGQEAFGWSPMAARREGPRKLVLSARSRAFDLEADPGELHDLMEEAPDWVTSARSETEDEVRRWEATVRDASRSASQAEAEALSALGYIAASGSPADGSSMLDAMRIRPDGTERREEFDAVTRAQRHVEAEEFEQVIPLLEAVRSENPYNGFALSILAGAYRRTGRLDESIRVYEEAAIADPRRPETQLMLARLYRVQGDGERSIAHYEKVMRFGLADLPSLREAAPILSAAGQTDRVLELLDARLRDAKNASASEQAELNALYAVCALEDQRAEIALPHVLRARELSDSPRLAVVHAQILRTQRDWGGILELLEPLAEPLDADDQFHLLIALAKDQTGASEQAIVHYRRSIALREPQFVAHVRLATLLLKATDGAQAALPHAARAVELDASQAFAHAQYVEVLLRLGNEQIARNHVIRFGPRFEGNTDFEQLYERVGVQRD